MQITKHFVLLTLVLVWLSACTNAVPEVACLKECNTATGYEFALDDGSLNFKGYFLSNSDVKLYEDGVEIPVQPTFSEGKLKVVPVSNSPYQLKSASIYKLLVTNAIANGTSTFTLESANIDTMAGDVSGTPSATSVDKIKGVAVTTTALTSGNFMKYNGTAWVNSSLSTSDVSGLSTSLSSLTTSLGTKIDQSQMPASCGAGSTLIFSSPTGSFACSSIAITDSQITYSSRTANTFLAAPNGSAGVPTFRALTLADLPAGIASQWTTAGGSNIYYSTGNVGIGTSSPSTALDVNGQIKISGGSPAAGKVLTSDGVGLASWQTPASITETDPKVGTNTTNYLPKWNGSALVTSGVYDSGSAIGINTSSPIARLDVRESNSSIPAANIRNDAANAVTLNITSAGGTSIALKSTAGGTGSVAGYFDGNSTGGPAALFLNGNVGIGLTNPTSPLTVAGNASITTINGISVGRGATADPYNTAVGTQSLPVATAGTGNFNTALGYYTLNSNTDGNSNTAIGSNVLRANTTGSQNTGIGTSALLANNLGNYNIAIGNTALQSNTSGSYNTAIGLGSMLNNTTGGQNVGVGYQSLKVATGSNNIAIGYQAGSSLTTQSNVVILGGHTGAGISDGNIVIANGSGVERLRVDAAGSVGIGTNITTYTLTVNGSVAGTTAFVNMSDKNLKRDIATIPDALEKIQSLRGVTYNWKTEAHPDLKLSHKQELGVVAQEVESVFPQAVSTAKETGIKSVAYSMLIAPIIEAIKEIVAIKADKKEVEELRAENVELRARLDRLEKALDKK